MITIISMGFSWSTSRISIRILSIISVPCSYGGCIFFSLLLMPRIFSMAVAREVEVGKMQQRWRWASCSQEDEEGRRLLTAKNFLLQQTSHQNSSVEAWASLISGYAGMGRGEDALGAYRQMLALGLRPHRSVFVSLFKACGSLRDLELCREFHGLAAASIDAPVSGFLGNTLVRVYGKCGSSEDAERVFSQMLLLALDRGLDVVSWNAMLSVYIEHGQYEKALRLFRQLVEEAEEEQVSSPDHISFVNALQACAGLAKRDKEEEGEGDGEEEASGASALEMGRALHADARRKGLSSDAYVRSTLLTMYGKCGSLIEAEHAFVSLDRRDVVSWNAMLSAYVEASEAKKALQLYSRMQEDGTEPNPQSMVIALRACGILAEREEELVVESGSSKTIPLRIGEALQEDAAARRDDFLSNSFVSNSLLTMFGRCGNLPRAEAVFEGSSKRGTVTWNAMLSAYIDQREPVKAMLLYRQLCKEREHLNRLTFLTLFQACGILADKEEEAARFSHCRERSNKAVALQIGRALHADARMKGCGSDLFVNNTLVSMYGKCGSIAEAECVFTGLPEYNIVACNAMISAYVDNNNSSKALRFYSEMLGKALKPNQLTFVLLLQACTGIADTAHGSGSREFVLELSHSLHAAIGEKGFDKDVWVGTTLLSMYGKCGVIDRAESMLDAMPISNVVPWNALLSAYVEQDQGSKALELYGRMQERNMAVTDITFLCVLQACGNEGCLETCKQVHFGVVCVGHDDNSATANTLIFAYGNSGDVVDATIVFDALRGHLTVSWNACIAGHAHEGNRAEGMRLLEEMHCEGKEPDEITFLSLLTVYSHSGLIEDGVHCFEHVAEGLRGVLPDMKHYAVLIDMLGRAGLLKCVQSIVAKMPMAPSQAIWLCVMSSCRTHGDVEMGEFTFRCALQFYPSDAALYVLMSNLYSEAGCVK
jgi:pentatricopeptide repeat protein